MSRPLHRHAFGTLALSAAAFFFAACSTSPMSRIDANRAVYESWPVDMQEAVLENRAVPGMTPEMAEMALGKPTSIDHRSVKDGEEEIWTYKKGSAHLPSLLENTNISLGGSVGGVGVSSGVPMGRGRPVDADTKEVVFKNGVVIRADP